MSCLQLFLVAIVLLCLAVTCVEGRSVPFFAQLTPENTGRVNSKNNDYVGQAFAYLATAGQEFRLAALIVSNLDLSDVTNVQLFNVADDELIEGTTFKQIDEGYFAFDGRISEDIGRNINIENVAVYIYTSSVGTKRPALSGLLLNNKRTYLALLKASEEVTPPTGTKNNVGFATILATTDDANNNFLTIAVNHDLDQTVTSIHLHAPAPSNANNAIVVDFPKFLQNGARVVNVAVNISVINWLDNDLGYINIHTTKNTAGALRGQVVPTTTPRKYSPTFPNKATANGVTQLPDGSTITGNVGLNLKQGGARNFTGDQNDPRVAVFRPKSGSFNNDFRFKLPVTIKNKYSLRQADIYVTAAAEVADSNKFSISPLNLVTLANGPSATIPGFGRRKFSPFLTEITADLFPLYLGPGGIFFNFLASGVSDNLYVDQLFVTYYVNNAYANNVLKSFFYSGSIAV